MPALAEVAVLIPVLARPERVQRVVDDLLASVVPAERVRIVFLVSPEDKTEAEAIRRVGLEPYVVTWPAGPGDYAKKMNLGVQVTDETYVFFGADDLHFHKGWLDAAVAVQERTGACVVGTNDLGNARTISGVHSTHPLVHRGYTGCGAIDDKRRLLHEGYDHNFVDDEFIQTATSRRTYVHAGHSVVEHLHPDWGKGTPDATYVKGKAHFDDDRLLFYRRRHLWRIR